ncbi:hypothetical protein ACF0H5_013395 [Mactra antiquata]
MSEIDKITEPNGIQSADVNEWKKTLRDQSPSPVRHSTRSRSPSPARSSARKRTPRKEAFSGTIPASPGVLMMEVPKPKSSTSKGPKMSQSTKLSQTRKSDMSVRGTKSLAASFGTSNQKSALKNGPSASTEGIEAEYIKNLQQQIYFLELETNYLYPF